MTNYPLFKVPPIPSGFDLVLNGESLNTPAYFIKSDTDLIIVRHKDQSLLPLFQGIKNNLQPPSNDFVGVWKWKGVINGENIGFTRIMCANPDEEPGYSIFNLSRKSYILSSSNQEYTFLDRELIDDGLADFFMGVYPKPLTPEEREKAKQLCSEIYKRVEKNNPLPL